MTGLDPPLVPGSLQPAGSAEFASSAISRELAVSWRRLISMPLSYLRSGYANNSYEREARAAVELTRVVHK
jgi:hypothetical protein